MLFLPSLKASANMHLWVQLPGGTSARWPTVDLIEATVRERLRAVDLPATADMPLRISRVDITFDFLHSGGSGAPQEVSGSQIVTRAAVTAYGETPPRSVRRTSRGRHFTGFHAGRGDVVCTLYDKVEERTRYAKRGSMRLTDWQAIWAASGVPMRKRDKVWRLEFQIRGKALRSWAASRTLSEFDAQKGDLLHWLLRWRTAPARQRRGAWIRVAEWRSRNNRPLVGWWARMLTALDGLDFTRQGTLPCPTPPSTNRDRLVNQVVWALDSVVAVDRVANPFVTHLDVLDQIGQLVERTAGDRAKRVAEKSQRIGASVWAQTPQPALV